MEGKRPRGGPKLQWKDTVRRDLKAWNIREEWATGREKYLQDPLPHREMVAKGGDSLYHPEDTYPVSGALSVSWQSRCTLEGTSCSVPPTVHRLAVFGTRNSAPLSSSSPSTAVYLQMTLRHYILAHVDMNPFMVRCNFALKP